LNAFWVAPLVLAALGLFWLAVQRAWLAVMQRPADSDALQRPGSCGNACACRADCPRQVAEHPVDPSSKELAS
jgi:hypothetical protein